MEKLLSEQSVSIQTLVAKAQKLGLLEASAMTLTINTTVEDIRSDRSVPVPRVTPREISIH